VLKKFEKESELALEACLKERGFAPDYEPVIEGKIKRIDFRAQVNETPVFFEVKEFAVKEIKKGKIKEDKITGGMFNPHKPIYAKIEDALPQLAEYAEFCCALVLYAPDASFVSLDPQTVLGGLLGPVSINVFAEPANGETGQEIVRWDASIGGYALDADTQKPRNEYLSAIVVIEKFPLGKFEIDAPWEKLRSDEALRLGKQELTYEESFALVTRFLAEDPKRSQAVLRASVFEHPYASHPLPREIFAGPYDEIFGREGDHMVCVFAGDELRKLKDAGVYPGRSLLFEQK
jgi:hypothetical protein